MINALSFVISILSFLSLQYARRAQAELELGKFDLALEDAEDAVDLSPASADYLAILCRALLNLNRSTEAWEICRTGYNLK